VRWSWVAVPKPPTGITPCAALKHFFNVRTLADASYRDGGAPNNDTLYSIAWIDVRKEPDILSHREMGDRYFAPHPKRSPRTIMCSLARRIVFSGWLRTRLHIAGASCVSLCAAII
jgi:hypothetical protein